MNCLCSGHFVKMCPSGQRCKKCHQPHHSWLHIDAKSKDRKASKARSHSKESSDMVTANMTRTVQHNQVLLMTCKVQILGRDGSTMQARTLLDSVSSTSLITKCLAQRLGLKRKQVKVSISGIGGHPGEVSPRSMVDFRIAFLKSEGK